MNSARVPLCDTQLPGFPDGEPPRRAHAVLAADFGVMLLLPWDWILLEIFHL